VPTRLPPLHVPPVGFAHRGARAHAPENTLEAFALARRLGATGLESDVWLTADGHAVLDHGGVVGRLRRTPLRRLERSALPAHVPTLAELLASGSADDLQVSLDVKDPEALDEVVAVARAAGALGRLWLCHDDEATLAGWRERADRARLVHSIRLRQARGGPERHAARLAGAGIDAVNLHHSDWTGGLVALYHRFGLLALAWDCQFPRTLHEVLDAGIDGVYSDHVDRMVEALARAAA
jgi:glycerophosphoryl diester phosphodiesterase